MFRIMMLSTGLTLAMAQSGFAVGSDDDTPPTPTQTTTECPEGAVWDVETATCVTIEETGLVTDPAALTRTVRELAYAGRHRDALALLDRAPDQSDSMVLTYRGFSTRSLGDMTGGMVHYTQALAADPDNRLARAYMGMAYLIIGQADRAAAQLAEIRARGGEGRWPEQALAAAIAQGTAAGYDY